MASPKRDVRRQCRRHAELRWLGANADDVRRVATRRFFIQICRPVICLVLQGVGALSLELASRSDDVQELHYWLMSGQHGAALRTLADPDGHASRLAAAIAILRAEYRSRISIERLAAEAAMSLTAFHKHFKRMTSLSPGQYQKRLRLIEARRLMLDEGFSASSAAFEVGYESVSQFTREYSRLFQAPKRDARCTRSTSRGVEEEMQDRERANAA